MAVASSISLKKGDAPGIPNGAFGRVFFTDDDRLCTRTLSDNSGAVRELVHKGDLPEERKAFTHSSYNVEWDITTAEFNYDYNTAICKSNTLAGGGEGARIINVDLTDVVYGSLYFVVYPKSIGDELQVYINSLSAYTVPDSASLQLYKLILLNLEGGIGDEQLLVKVGDLL